MPCDGIAVAVIQAATDTATESTKFLARRIRRLIEENGIQVAAIGLDDPETDEVKLHLNSVPLMSLAIKGGTITVITTDGTYEAGEKAIKDWLMKNVLLPANPSATMVGEVETHTHGPEGEAPWQAYAEQGE